MKHITKKRVSRGRKRGQVRTQARPRKRASVTRHRKKNKSRRGFYTKKKKVMAGGVQPEGWDNMTVEDQMKYAYDQSGWKNLDDDTKISLIYKIPKSNVVLDNKLLLLNNNSTSSQRVKDAIANRNSSQASAAAYEPPNLLAKLQPEQNIDGVHIDPKPLEEVETKNNKSDKNTRTVTCDCTRSFQPHTPPTLGRFGKFKEWLKKKTNKA